MKRARVAVLISGRGSNMEALARTAASPAYPADIALVLSDQPQAAGPRRAAELGIPTAVVERGGFASRAEFEAALGATLREASIDLVCLAGFMRVLSADFVESWCDRLLNIHPSLLPAFPGLDTHARALAAGVRIHGATVHFVRALVDDGPIICQAAVPVLDGDTPETLAARVLAVEHRIYPQALAWVAGGSARVLDENVAIDGADRHDGAMLFSPSVDVF